MGNVGLMQIAKIKQNSTLAHRYGADEDMDLAKNTTTLRDFLIQHPIQSKGIDMDTKDDDRLSGYNVSQIIPLKNVEVDNVGGGLYLITDSKGYDIGTYEITENGPVFKLSPKIKEQNEKIIEMFGKEEQDVLRKAYDINSLEDVVDMLSRGEELKLDFKKAEQELREEHSRENEESTREEGSSEDELEEESEAREQEGEEIEDSERPEVQKLRAEGKTIKQVLIVQCPENIENDMPNGINNIDPHGEEIVMVLTTSGGDASRITDELYMYQGGVEVPNVRKDQEQLKEAMQANRGKSEVVNLNESGQPLVYDEILEEMQRLQADIKYIESHKEDFETPEDVEKAIDSAKRSTVDAIGEKIGGRALEENMPIVEEKTNATIEATLGEKPAEQEQDDGEMTIYSGHDHEHTLGVYPKH